MATVEKQALGAYDLAALYVAGKRFDSEARAKMVPGAYEVDETVRIKGMVKVGNPTTTTSGADYSSVLAVALSLMTGEQKSQLRVLVEFASECATEKDRADVKELCKPTQRKIERAGSVSGIVSVELV